MPQLVYHPGHTDEKAFDLAAGAFVVGRGPECDIFVPGASLSRRHARIEVEGQRVVIVDLGSKNGSYVNGVRVSRQVLASGDVMKLGELELTFVDDLPVSAPTSGIDNPTLVMSLTRLTIGELLTPGPAAGALKVRPTQGDQRAQDKLQVLLQISQLLSSPEEPDALLGKILELVFQTLDVDRGAVLLVDPESGALVPRVVRSQRPGTEPIYSQRIAEYVRKNSVAALFGDAAFDPRIDSSRSILVQSIRASMCVPLKPKDKVIGVLYVDNLTVPNRFSQEDLEFLAAFANQAAVAIENAALYKRLEAETMSRMQVIMAEKLRALAEVVAGVAHEIRNPLNFVINFADVGASLSTDVGDAIAALRGKADVDDLEDDVRELGETLARIREHGQRIDDIVQRMVLHGRNTPSAFAEAQINVVVADSLDGALRAFATRDAAFAPRLVTDYDPEAGKAEVLAGDVGRVIANVVDNAFYAMRERRRAEGAAYAPELHVSTRGLAGAVEILLRDNGTGIPAAILDKVWTPFFTTKPTGEGTGLGLSLSHDIIALRHRGEIRLTSEPGRFTEVIISLPRRAAEPPGAARPR